MKRFETIYKDGLYEVTRDNYNNLYAVFVKCEHFKQQLSIWYMRESSARKYLTRLMSL